MKLHGNGVVVVVVVMVMVMVMAHVPSLNIGYSSRAEVRAQCGYTPPVALEGIDGCTEGWAVVILR